jgi:large subunit ribosomal protein L46
VFFLKAFYQSGTLELDKEELVDYVWVTREEMRDYVSEEYYQAVKPILTD